MIELPAVDVLQCILRQLVANSSQVHAQLADVLETELVADRAIDGKQLNETVLRSSEAVLNRMAPSTCLACSEELIVHSLESCFI